MGEGAAFHVHAELVVFGGVSGHDFEQTLLGPRRAVFVGEHFTFGQIFGEAVEYVRKVLLGEASHNLENSLADHVDKALLVVGDVGGGLVGTEGLLRFVFGGSRFQALLVVFGMGHLFPFFQQARVYTADHVAQVVLHLEEFFVLVAVGHRLRKDLVHVVQMAQ